jgi:gamma-glutamyl-gamma-aminobutyrate hydrolase PuuD
MPRIAIACGRRMGDYKAALASTRAEPLVVDRRRHDPADVVRRVDGLMLLGGSDVDPALYGEAAHATYEPADPGRDAFEIALVRHAVEADLPLLAICRGIQVLNVALGGSLRRTRRSLGGGGQPDRSAPRFRTATHSTCDVLGNRSNASRFVSA